jgi:DNA-binding transcriptional regulator LsrR (DeoR family)
MNTGVERTQLLVEVAALYRERGLSQPEVAGSPDLCRSNVSTLEGELRERFGLKGAPVMVKSIEDWAFGSREVKVLREVGM